MMMENNKNNYNYHTNFNLSGAVNDFETAKAYLIEDDMTEYLKNDIKKTGKQDFSESVEHVEWVLESESGGKITLVTNRPLEDDELKHISRWVREQCADGVGAGFSQQEFAEDPYDEETPTEFNWMMNEFQFEKDFDESKIEKNADLDDLEQLVYGGAVGVSEHYSDFMYLDVFSNGERMITCRLDKNNEKSFDTVGWGKMDYKGFSEYIAKLNKAMPIAEKLDNVSNPFERLKNMLLSKDEYWKKQKTVSNDIVQQFGLQDMKGNFECQMENGNVMKFTKLSDDLLKFSLTDTNGKNVLSFNMGAGTVRMGEDRVNFSTMMKKYETSIMYKIFDFINMLDSTMVSAKELADNE